jgi:ketosteroid isomerase-like protein
MGQAKDVVDRVWAAMEAGELDALQPLLDPDIEFRMGPEAGKGWGFFRPFLEGYLRGFPDLRHEELDHVELGDTIALELLVRGTHAGPLQTPQGELPPTGRDVVWESVDYVKVRDGRIASWHVYTDSLAFMTQLGLVGAPSQPAVNQ